MARHPQVADPAPVVIQVIPKVALGPPLIVCLRFDFFAHGGTDTTLMCPALAWISVLALAYALVAWAEKVFLRWHVSQRTSPGRSGS